MVLGGSAVGFMDRTKHKVSKGGVRMCEENVVSALLLYYKGRMNIIIVREHVNVTCERPYDH